MGRLDAGKVPAAIIPMLGDGAVAGTLLQQVGSFVSGELMTKTMTNGPVLKSTLRPPAFSTGTPRHGADGWWTVWNRQVLQDYRSFTPVHAGVCNILFADGSVRAVVDVNQDGYLNNGFEPASGGGFADAEQEMAPQEIMSQYSLNSEFVP